jgi:hypothetical protein
MSSHARRMTSLSMLIFSRGIIFSKLNNDSACQTSTSRKRYKPRTYVQSGNSAEEQIKAT